MPAKLRSRLTYANMMATVAVFIALGGSSYAAIKVTGKNVKDSSLTGKDIRNSSLTTSEVKNGSLLSSDFRSGQLPGAAKGDKGDKGDQGVQGVQGDKGVQGVQGDNGEPATRLWAVINTAGATLRQSGSTSSASLSTGQYEVIFNRDVTGCSYQATQSELSAITGETVVQPRTTTANGVFVGTATSAGASANRAFHLAVFC